VNSPGDCAVILGVTAGVCIGSRWVHSPESAFTEASILVSVVHVYACCAFRGEGTKVPCRCLTRSSAGIPKRCCFSFTTSLLLQLPSAYELLLAMPRLLLGFGVLFLTRAVVKVVGGAVSERVLALLGHPPSSTPRAQR
jgi:hypothetical protein